MKKILFLFSAITLIVGCTQDFLNEKHHTHGATDGVGGSELPEVVCGYMSDVDKTRTYVEDDKMVLWHGGDAVSYFAVNKHNVKYQYDGKDGVATAEFTKDDNTGYVASVVMYSKAVYPYNEATTYKYEDGVEVLGVVYPAEQTYAPNSFGRGANMMVASGKNNTDEQLYFRNACGYFILKLYDAQEMAVRRIELTALGGEKIAGEGNIVAGDGAPEITMRGEAASMVALDCGDQGVVLGAEKESATEFWFALPPVTFAEGLRIVVTDTNNQSYLMETKKSVTIARNEIQPMAALNVKMQTTAITKLAYTRANGEEPLSFAEGSFGSVIKSHDYDESLGAYLIDFELPLTTIGADAFKGSDVVSVAIPTTVTSIDSQAFMDCANLEEVIMPEQLVTLGDEAFRGCAMLGEVTLPEGLATIGVSALQGTAIEEITIPGSVNSIGVNCFYHCSELSSVTFEPSATRTAMQIGCVDRNTTFESHFGAFASCPLSTINLNRQLLPIDEDGNSYSSDTAKGVFEQCAPTGDTVSYPAEATIVIGEQVEVITHAMFKSINIKELYIPNTVSKIEYWAFSDCVKLERVTFEEGSTTLDVRHDYLTSTHPKDCGPFASSPLKQITLGRDVVYKNVANVENTTIGTGLFARNNLQDADYETVVVLGSQLKTIGNCMFYCQPIKKLTIPGSVNQAKKNAFFGLVDLEEIVFEPSPTEESLYMDYNTNTVGFDSVHGSFVYSAKLKKAVLNRDIIYSLTKDLGDDDGIFSNRAQLTDIIFGEQFKTVSAGMFSGCNGFSVMEVPASVTSVGEGAFANCDALKTMIVGDNVKSLGARVFAECDKLSSLIIGGGVNTIGDDAFLNCKDLGVVTFYASPTGETLTIGNCYYSSAGSAPFYSTPVERVNLLREVSTEHGLFCYQESLKYVVLGNQVKTLGASMFFETDIRSITIPNSVNFIGIGAFAYCESLATVNFEDGPNPLTISFDRLSYDGLVDVYQTGPFYSSPLKNIHVGRELVYVGEKGKEFTPDEEDEGIFYSDLYDEVDKVTLTIGSNVKTIHPYMFNRLRVEEVVLPEGVTTIGHTAFAYCTKLASITIPGSVTKIGNYAFDECTSLSRLTFEGSSEPLHIGYNDYASDKGPFYYSPLSYINLNREMVYDYDNLDAWDEGIFANEFYSTSTLTTELILGENVKTISDYMFSGVRLKTLTIPANIKSIGYRAFYDCRNLDGVICYSTTPPTLGKGAFDSCDVFKYIKVPNDYVSKYQTTGNWADYASKITSMTSAN